VLKSILLIATAFSVSQPALQLASQTIVEDGAGGMARAANRMIGGIISYVGWPDKRGAAGRNLCQVGTPQLASDPVAAGLPNGRHLIVRRITAAAAIADGDCDILFLGRMPVGDRQRLIGWVRTRAVLTITDDDPACLYGAMFCLARRSAGLGFSVNLDAIGRSPLRVDPRVLQIGHGDGGTS